LDAVSDAFNEAFCRRCRIYCCRLHGMKVLNCGDGIAVGWLGHAIVKDQDGYELYVRRMPPFFKNFLLS
jgi:hypothetical protein